VLQQWALALEATAESERRSKGVKGIITKTRRKMGEVAPVITPALQMIPDDLSVLHGGLALIFSVRITSSLYRLIPSNPRQLARHRESCRWMILTAFEDIPDIIEMARRKAETFRSDRELMEKVQNLKLTLLKSLPILIDLLCPGTYREC
jgi:hypothetical protein